MTNKKWFLYFLLSGVPLSIYGLLVILKILMNHRDLNNLMEAVSGGLFLIAGFTALFFARHYYSKHKKENNGVE
jgi:hypothetical protein